MFEFEPVTYEFEEVNEVEAEFFSVGLALLNVPVGDGVSDEERSLTVPVAGCCSFFLSLKMFLKAIVVVLGGGGSEGEDCG